jgi:hypothetical protein
MPSHFCTFELNFWILGGINVKIFYHDTNVYDNNIRIIRNIFKVLVFCDVKRNSRNNNY